jgi:hypothetical protein
MQIQNPKQSSQKIRDRFQILNVSMTKPKTSEAITLVVGIGGDLGDIWVFRFEHLNFGF